MREGVDATQAPAVHSAGAIATGIIVQLLLNR